MNASNRHAMARDEMERNRKMSGSLISAVMEAVMEKGEGGSTVAATAAAVLSLVGGAAVVSVVMAGSTASSRCTRLGCIGLLCMMDDMWMMKKMKNNEDEECVMYFLI